MQRPPGYNPLGIKNLDPDWIRRLGQTGKDCYAAILAQDVTALGASMNECMRCWETLLPHTVRHPTITVDLVALLEYYQARYPGAMYSGCGGGYLYVVSERARAGGVPGQGEKDSVMAAQTVVVTGSLDELVSRHVRLLEEASRLGRVHVLLWSDDVVRQSTGHAPRFAEAERLYVLEAIRYVSGVSLVRELPQGDTLAVVPGLEPDIWAMASDEATPERRSFCAARGIACHTLAPADLHGFPELEGQPSVAASTRKKAIVTGCFDWLHSGHVRFFEEVSGLGDLYVIVGHDANVRLLKGEGHPLFPQDRAALYGAGRAPRYSGADLLGPRLDGCGARDRLAQARPLCGKRGRRQAGEARVLPRARHRVCRAQAPAQRGPARPAQHRPTRILGGILL